MCLACVFPFLIHEARLYSLNTPIYYAKQRIFVVPLLDNNAQCFFPSEILILPPVAFSSSDIHCTIASSYSRSPIFFGRRRHPRLSPHGCKGSTPALGWHGIVRVAGPGPSENYMPHPTHFWSPCVGGHRYCQIVFRNCQICPGKKFYFVLPLRVLSWH